MNIKRRTVLRSLGGASASMVAGCLRGDKSKQVGEAGELTPKESLTDDFEHNHLHGVAYDHLNEQLYLATHYGLFVLQNDEDLYLVGDSTDDFMGFTMHPKNTKILYRSGHSRNGGNLGVERSEDGGMTWTQIFTGIAGETVDFHLMTISHADPSILLGGYGGKLYVTENSGENWRIVASEGLPEQGPCWGVPCLAPDSSDSSTVFAGTQEGLYASTDLGNTWKHRSARGIAAVMVHPKDASRIYGFTQKEIVRSTDRGRTWTVLQSEIQFRENEHIFQFAANRNTSEVIYAGTTADRALKTSNSGKSWEVVI